MSVFTSRGGFTSAGEFQSRGGKSFKHRFGPRMLRADLRRKGDKKNLTPNKIAINKLSRLLEKPELQQRDRSRYTNLLEPSEQLRFMNMPVLAQVILFLNEKNNVIDWETLKRAEFHKYIEHLLDTLLPKRDTAEGGGKTKAISDEDLDLYRYRMEATFIRYMSYVLGLMEANAQQIAQIENEYAPAGTIDLG